MASRSTIILALAGLASAIGLSTAVAAHDDPWSSTEIAAPLMRNQPLKRGAAGTSSGAPGGAGISQVDVEKPGGNPSQTSGWSRTTLALAGVLGLIAVLTLVSRKLRFLPTARRPGLIQILSRTPLSARQSLCLVRIGPRAVLLGVTQDRISALDVIEDAALTASLAGEASQAAVDSNSAEFKKRLDSEVRLYSDDDNEAEVEEDDTAAGGRLREVRRKLAGSLRRLGAIRSA